ncbi:MAG: L,D-transpeptidase family protein [Bdellovibrionota bacterium]
MKSTRFTIYFLPALALALLLGAISQLGLAQDPLPAPTGNGEVIVIVDKTKHELHLARVQNGYEIFKTYPVTTGKNSGDKMVEGDLKTPEGIYQFSQRYNQSQLKKKFGIMAFYIDYPNLIDKSEKKTGFDIMLHSTDDPARLARPQDSDGCVVVNDERIKEIDPFIIPQKTMILIYDELKPAYLLPGTTEKVKTVFDTWLKAWSEKDLEAYIALYSKNFRGKNMNRDQYKIYKGFLNKKYDTIKVTASDIRYFTHPKYSMVTYHQQYLATYKGGREAFNVSSRKRLYLIPEDGALKIFSEGN